MAEPEIIVQKATYSVPVSVTGVDEMGRTTIICPHCREDAYIEADGRVVCSMWQPAESFLAAAYDRLLMAALND